MAWPLRMVYVCVINLSYNAVMKNTFYYMIILSMAITAILQVSACRHSPYVPNPDDMMPIDTTTQPIDTTQQGTPCDPNAVYFDLQVLPILQSNCAFSGCHDAASAQDGVVLTSYNEVMRTADVRPFNLGGSDLYEVITENDNDDVMPPAPRSRLSATQIALIAQWIQAGALNLTCDPNAGACNTAMMRFGMDIRPILQNSCIGCHSGSSPSGGINLGVYDGVRSVALNGRLLGAIRHSTGYAAMPQGGSRMSDCNIDKIAAWIADGALNN